MPVIPVITVDDDQYKVPTKIDGGQYVVSAKQNNLKLDRVFFFDLDTKQYRVVSPYEASPDYVKQVQDFETKASEIRAKNTEKMSMIADSTDPTQVNSIADVFSKSLSWNPLETVHDTFQNTFGYLDNYLVKPIINADASLGEKGAILLQNALTNLGETMDYVTGANFIKGLAQGNSLEEAASSWAWDEQNGRKQYDWNVDTGYGGGVDFIANFALEFVSDPTNWITFGTKSLLKSGITDNMSSVLLKSADEAGIPLLKGQADELASNIFKTVARGEDLSSTLLTARIGKVVPLEDPRTYKNFLDNVVKNIDVVKESKDFAILKTVTNTMDKLNQVPMRAAMYTSAIGIGGKLTKQVFKTGIDGINYAVSKMNKAVNEGAADMSLANISETNKAVLSNVTKLSHVLNLDKEIPDQVIAHRTATIQSEALLKLQNVVNNSRGNTDTLIREVRTWAQDQGFADIFDAYAKLKSGQSRLAEGMRALSNDLFEVIRTYQAHSQIKSWQPLVDLFKDESLLPNMRATDIRTLLETLKKRQPLSTLDYFEDVDLREYNQLEQLTESWYYKVAVNELLEQLDIVHKGIMPDKIFLADAGNYTANVQSFSELTKHVNVIKNMLAEFSTDENLKKFTALAFPGTDKYDITKVMSKLQDSLTRYNNIRSAGASAESLLKVRDIIKRQIMNTLGNYRRIANLSHAIFRDVDKNTAYLYEGTRDFIARIERTLEEAQTVITRDNYITPVTTGKTAQQLRNSGTNVIEKALKEISKDATREQLSEVFLDTPKRAGNVETTRELENIALQNITLLDNMITQHVNDHSVIGDMFIYTGVRDLVQEAVINKTIDTSTLRQIYNVLDVTSPSKHNEDLLKFSSDHDLGQLYSMGQRMYGLLDSLENAEYDEMNVTISNLASNIDAIKISQAEALKTILSNPVITDSLSQILNKGDLGLVTELLAASDNPTVAQVAEDIRALASSSWVMTRLSQQIEKSDVPDDWKSAIYDTLAGMMRMEIDDINPEYMANYILTKSKNFIDRTNNAQPNLMYGMMNNFVSPASHVSAMVRFLANPENSTDWNAAFKSVQSDGTTYDMYYSIGQLNKSSGNIYEFAYATPQGKVVRIVNEALMPSAKEALASDYHTKDMYGMSADKVAEQLAYEEKYYLNKIDTISCATVEEFNLRVSEVFENAKSVIRQSQEDAKNTKSSVAMEQIRLIGFGNSGEAFNSDSVLNKFFALNKVNTRVGGYNSLLNAKTLDIQQIVRQQNYKAVTITDDLRTKLTMMLEPIKKYMDEYNRVHLSADGASVKFMPDFSSGVMTSLDSLIDMLSETLYYANAAQTRSIDDKLLFITPEEFHKLRALGSETIVDMLNRYNDLRLALRNSLSTIKEANSKLAERMVVRENLKKLSGDKNIQHFLQNNLVEGIGTPALGWKTYFRVELFKDWFPYLLNRAELDGRTAFKLNDIASKLQRDINRYAHPELLYGNYTPALREVLNGLIGYTNLYSKSASYKNFMTALKYMTKPTVEQQYAIIQRLLQFARSSAPSSSTFEAYIESVLKDVEIGHPLQEAWMLVLNHNLYVGFDQSMYSQGIDVLHSPYVTDNTGVLSMFKDIENTLRLAKLTGKTLDDSLAIDAMLRSQYGANSINFRMKEPLIKLYNRFLEDVQFYANVGKVYIDDYADALGNPKGSLAIRKAYDANIRAFIDGIKSMGEEYNMNRVNNILSLTPKEYLLYLYKHSQGVQVFDLMSDTLKSPKMAERLQEMLKTFKENPTLGIDYKAVDNYLYVYIKKDSQLLDALKETVTKGGDAARVPVKYNAVSESHYYKELHDTLQNSLDEAYAMSMQRTMNLGIYKELLAKLPEDIKANILDIDYLTKNDLIRGFNHTLVGDYGFGTNTFFENYSNNFVSNTVAGANSIFNDIRGKESYLTFINNKDNTLRARLDAIYQKSDIKPTADDIRRALDNTGHVLTYYDGKHMVEIVPKSNKDIVEALDKNALLLDRMTLDRLKTVLEDNRLQTKGFLKHMHNYLLLLKIGLLNSTGWLVRNIPDSAIKGMVGNNAGSEYFGRSFLNTIKAMKKYDEVYAHIIQEHGNVGVRSIEEYFKNTKVDGIDKTLFIKMFDFINSSASAPTAAQMSIYNNTAEKLYQKIKGLGTIRKDDIEVMLKRYQEHKGSYTKVYDALKEQFPDTYEDMMKLFQMIPKSMGEDLKTAPVLRILEQFMNHNPLFIYSNKIESISRMHAFLYGAEYSSGYMGKAFDVVNKTQFNRTHDTPGQRLLEMFLPFSSFQIDNIIFWLEVLENGRGGILSTINDYLESRYDEEELNSEDIVNNISMRYMFLNGNIIIGEESGLTFKLNDSLTNVLGFVADPWTNTQEMFNIPAKTLRTLIEAINQDPEKYEEDSFNKTKPIAQWDKEDISKELWELVPVFGALRLRYMNAWTKETNDPTSLWVQRLMPSLFSITKSRESGLAYNARPIGYNWYANIEADPNYSKTHQYVFGLSYVGSWITKDPATYANTRQRLIAMGFSEELATKMVVEWGFYMKAPDYILKQYNPDAVYPVYQKYMRKFHDYKPRKYYTRRAYIPKVKKPVRVRGIQDYSSFSRPMRLKQVRMYKSTSAYYHYTKTGASRNMMMEQRGYGPSAARLIRDQMVSHNIRMNSKRYRLGLF